MAVAARPIRQPLPAVYARSLSPAFAARTALTLLVIAGSSVRTILGLFRETPIYLGDEYLYAALGRSIAEGGHPLVRGESAHFPALLQPLLTAPAWLFPDVATGYHLAQGIGALAMSLAAVPVYWLGRRLGLGQGLALALAALALLLPDLIYASWIVAEPFAYPLTLGAVAAGVAALGRPTRRSQIAFVALASLASFARIQFVVLPLCFLATVVIVGLRERRLLAALREQLLPLALFTAPIAVTVALGPARVLAFYGGVVDVHIDPVSVLQRSGANLLVLLYASGFVLIPAALLGVFYAIARPRSRAELAFAVLTLSLTAALLAEAGLFGAADQAQERYVFYVLPLAGILFGLYASRGWPSRLHHALLATVLIALASLVPLAGFAAAEEKMHSPLLYGVFRIQEWLGTPGSGSLVVALAATFGMLAVVALSARPRVASVTGLVCAGALSGAFAVSAVVFDVENTRSARHAFFGDNPSWVDDAGVGDVTLLRNVWAQRGAAFQQLFWNRSIKRLALMPGAPIIDPFAAEAVTVDRDGSFRMGGERLTGALLVDQHAVTMRLTGARKIASAPGFWLYEPTGIPRASLLFVGRFHDGWLNEAGAVTLWPRPGRERIEGSLALELRGPAMPGATTVHFRLPHGASVDVRVPGSGTATVFLPVCSPGPWTAAFRSQVTGYVGTRPVSVRSSEPRFVAGSDGCSAKPRQHVVPPRSRSDTTV